MKSLLLSHFTKYPKMELRDMVKLIYQMEFAGGHLIKNAKESLERIINERGALQPCADACPHAFEPIGNGLVRLHLQHMDATGITPDMVNQFFIHTAQSIKGTEGGFEAKVDTLRQCCVRGELPYDVEGLDAYMAKLKGQGYPAVSHSQTYRDAYAPAYRIVKAVFGDYIKLFSAIDAQVASLKPVTIAIEGRSGAGKSTLASLLGDIYDCNVFHMDDFFLPVERKTRERLAEVGGNVDYERFKEDVIRGIASGKEFNYRPFSCKEGCLGDPIAVEPKLLNIVEGVYSMHSTLVDTYDLKVFIDISPEEQSRRILQRNGEAMHKRFMDEWIPLENRYFDACRIMDGVDLYYDVGTF